MPEIHDVLLKVRQLAITSETPSVRAQCRQVDLQYLLDYPLGKKIKTPLEFYVSQLSYQTESGRRSALDMLMSMFNTFPEVTMCRFTWPHSLFDYTEAWRDVFFDTLHCTSVLIAESFKDNKGQIQNLCQTLDLHYTSYLYVNCHLIKASCMFAVAESQRVEHVQLRLSILGLTNKF